MYVLIDKERMCVCYKHEKAEVLASIGHIELAGVEFGVYPINTLGCFLKITELNSLYLSICGHEFMGNIFSILLSVVKLIEAIPMSNLDGFKIAVQALLISEEDDQFYRYNSTGNAPIKLSEQYLPKPLTASLNAAPVVCAVQPQQNAPIPVAQAPAPVNKQGVPLVVTNWKTKNP